MSKSGRRMQRFLVPDRKSEPKENPLYNFKKTWYLDGWFSKTIFIVGFLAILWTLFKWVILRTW